MTPANSTLFLAVGAGGVHAATGNHVARQLLARGLPVRALVRRADERATELSELGADIATWREVLSRIPVVTAYLIEHLAAVAESHQHGEFDAVTGVVETIGGASPKSLEMFIRQTPTTLGAQR